ncbi:MAG: DnaD domain protein [Lachnospiraceae bacterium]|nr:DnaD domain protein [Lachnospiraceae bacterium]
MKLQYGTVPVVLPGEALTKARSLDELRVLAFLSANRDLLGGCPANAEEIASASGIAKETVLSALNYFEGAGILTPGGGASAKKEKKPVPRADDEGTVLRGSEIAQTVADEPRLKELIDVLQARIGKRFFNDSEYSKLAELVYDWKLENDYLILLTDHLIRQGRGSIGYVYRVAVGYAQNGIDTYDALNHKLLTDEKTAPIRGKLRKLFGWGERSLTAAENGFMKLWLEDWELSYELMEYAYELTVDGTGGKFQIRYMARILAAWHEKGITDPEAAKADHENGKPVKTEKAKASTFGSFDTDDFISAALERSYAEMKSGDTK